MTGRAKNGALAGAMLLAGCGASVGSGSSVGSRPVAQFPSAAEITALEGQPITKPVIPKMAAAVDRWDIEMAPRPEAGNAPWEPVGGWETLFGEVAARALRKPRLTLAMGCIAHEIGRFHLEHREQPNEGLLRFFIGGCGGLTQQVQVQRLTWQVPAAVPDEDFFAKARDQLRAELEKGLDRGTDVAGFWFGRRDDRAGAYLVSANELAEIKPFSLAPSAKGEVVIEGRLKGDAQFFEALINHGDAEVDSCEVDLSVARPGFRFVCRPDSGDETAWIQMLYAPPKQVLATTFAQALVRRSPDVPPSYQAVHYADPMKVANAAEFTGAVIQQLNAVRSAVKLPPVTLAVGESATATKLAPIYFASMLGTTGPEQANTIALGLLAGWEVPGMIRGGNLMSELAPTMDAGRWLTSALEMPLGRFTLFAPDIEQVALGSLVLQDPGVIGAVVTGYRFHHGNDHKNDVNELLTRVVQARRRMGLPSPTRLGKVAQVMDEELAAVNQGQALPMDALNHVLERAMQSFGVGMRGFVIEVSSLDELQIPEEILRQPKLQLDIGVTHHKAAGAAWAQYTILVVYAALDH